MENPPVLTPEDDPGRTDMVLNTIIPEDAKEPYSMHDVIARVVDINSFFEIQPNFAKNAANTTGGVPITRTLKKSFLK